MVYFPLNETLVAHNKDGRAQKWPWWRTPLRGFLLIPAFYRFLINYWSHVELFLCFRENKIREKQKEKKWTCTVKVRPVCMCEGLWFMRFVEVPGPQQVLRISRVLCLDMCWVCGLVSFLSSQLSAPRPHVDINKNRQLAAKQRGVLPSQGDGFGLAERGLRWASLKFCRYLWTLGHCSVTQVLAWSNWWIMIEMWK